MTKVGSWFVVAVVSRPNWIGLCTSIGREDMIDDPRFAENHFRVENRDALIPQLEAAFATKLGEDWMRILEAAGVPVGPVLCYPMLRYLYICQLLLFAVFPRLFCYPTMRFPQSLHHQRLTPQSRLP